MSHSYVPEFPVEPGKFYYAVDCPQTGKSLLFGEDESRGRKPHPAGPLIISCHHCQIVHQIDSPVIRSQEARKMVL